MLDMPPVTHIKSGHEDPPYQGKILDPFFPFTHPLEIMQRLFEQHTPFKKAREIAVESWKEYHERELTEDEAKSIDALEEEWERRLFPFETPMDLLEFQIEDLDFTGWLDVVENGITDEMMIERVKELWLVYKDEHIDEEVLSSLFERLATHDRKDLPEDFPFPKPVDLLRSLLDAGKMEMDVDKQFYDPKLTTVGEKESRITATFSIEEKDKLEMAYKLWMERRRRDWTDEETEECNALMVERGIIEPPKEVESEQGVESDPESDESILDRVKDLLGMGDTPDEESDEESAEEPESKFEVTDYTVERISEEEVRALAKDVFNGVKNIWFGKPEDGMVMMMLMMINILNPEDAGAIIGTDKDNSGRVTSHNGGPYRAACFGFSILHKENVKQFVAEFNRMAEFMSEFEAPPRDIPEDEKPWEKTNITIRQVQEDEQD